MAVILYTRVMISIFQVIYLKQDHIKYDLLRKSYLYNHNWILFSRPNNTIYNSECVYVRWLSDNKKIYAVQSSFWDDLSVENNYITIETLFLYFAHCGGNTSYVHEWNPSSIYTLFTQWLSYVSQNHWKRFANIMHKCILVYLFENISIFQTNALSRSYFYNLNDDIVYSFTIRVMVKI